MFWGDSVVHHFLRVWRDRGKRSAARQSQTGKDRAKDINLKNDRRPNRLLKTKNKSEDQEEDNNQRTRQERQRQDITMIK
jgi:hypothetical protein